MFIVLDQVTSEAFACFQLGRTSVGTISQELRGMTGKVTAGLFLSPTVEGRGQRR